MKNQHTQASFFSQHGSLGLFTLRALAVSALLAGMSACSVLPKAAPDSTQFYVLSAEAPASTVAALATGDGPRVVVRQVELPGYLENSRSLVVRNGEHEILYRDFAHWAEPLDAGVARIVSQRLVAAGAVLNVDTRASRMDRDYDIAIRILYFEGSQAVDGTRGIRFAADYQFISPNGATIISSGHFEAPAASWDGHDYTVLVRLLSEATTLLADDIAAHMVALKAR